MNKLERLFYTLKNKYFFWIFPDPKPSSIDISGIVWSDYPHYGNGWIKGFLLNTPSRDIIVTAKHCSPSTLGPNNKVVFFDNNGERIERTIISVNKDNYKLDGKTDSPEINMGKPERYYLGGDVAICKLDEPLPSNIKEYNICTSEKIISKRSICFNQKKQPTSAVTFFSDSLAWVIGRKRKLDGDRLLLKAGDSGLPWFVWNDGEWQIITVTSRGEWGEGSFLGHKFIYTDLINNIYKL